MARVELRRLTKVFPGGIEALVGLDLTIPNGEYLAIVGPSGSGKSTLLRLIAGLDEATRGEVWIDGRRADGLAPASRDVAMVFQDQPLYPHLDVAENLAFSIRARRRPEAEVRERVGEVAALLGLSDLLDRMPQALSGGQRRRVSLGRALARRPGLLLLDEPLSGLDAPLRSAMRADLGDLHHRLGTTTLHVTHDQAEAMALGDRVAILADGRLAQVGTPRELYDRPDTRFVAQFLGSPPMNVLPCHVEPDGDGARLRLDGTEAVYRGSGSPPVVGPVDLGWRPEQMELIGDDGGEGTPWAVPAVVHRVEPRGHESWVTLDLGPHRATIRVPPGAEPPIGAAVRLGLDPAQAAWFDRATGRRA